MKALIYWALGGIGGIQRMYPFTIKALQSCGYDVHVATSYDINPEDVIKYHGVKISNVHIIKFPRLSCDKFYSIPCDLINTTISATKFLSMIDGYDLVYVDTPYVGPIFKYSVPRHNNLVFYLHAPIERSKPVIPIAKPHRILMHAYLASGTNYDIIRNARLVLANSKFTAYITEKTLGVKPRVLYPPVDVDLIAKYRSNDREDAVVFFARLSRAKGPEQAIMIAKELVREGFNPKVYIMGSVSGQIGSLYVSSLIKLVRSLGLIRNVIFVINPSITEVYSILGRSKVFLHFREHEPFGIVIVEAMAAGAVPIVPRSGAPWHDIIEYGKYGIGYSSIEELVKAVKYLLSGGYNEYFRRTISRAYSFNVDKYINEFCKIIKNVPDYS